MLDHGDQHCLPVVAARLNPALDLPFDDIDLQHALAREHWYVCGYKMSYLDPVDDEQLPLFSDADATETMLRVVVKANLTRHLVSHLLRTINDILPQLDVLGPGFLEE